VPIPPFTPPSLTTYRVCYQAIVYATCRKPNADLAAVGVHKVIQGVDVRNDSDMKALVAGVDQPLDILINNAGYFKKERESVREATMVTDRNNHKKSPLSCCVVYFSTPLCKDINSCTIYFLHVTKQTETINFLNPAGFLRRSRHDRHLRRGAAQGHQRTVPGQQAAKGR
jgi:NAD(P)-dependent dehydrogenase (short-subunit alcohol dehydrogenase family)